jgi:thiamine-phosphate pyrophosphorylase
MEEYCRFALSSKPLSARAKRLRHRISATVSELGIDNLVAARDAVSDVGQGLQVDDQLKRADLREGFIAGAKRITEALRVLAETVSPINSKAYHEFEKLRFDAYTLEKDVLACDNTSARFAPVSLYVLINASHETQSQEIVSLVNACAAGGADCIQLRAKDITDKHLLALAMDFVIACSAVNVISIINDRADIAILAGADGVHLGQGDLAVEDVRAIQHKPLIIGVSTHNLQQLQTAIATGPAYVALGPAFATPTKPNIDIAGIGYLQQAVNFLDATGINYLAIGGITAENISEILDLGVKTVAVCSAVCHDHDAENACKRLKNAIVNHA